jgi:hypothetical protein
MKLKTRAHIAFLTNPSPGVFVFNTTIQGMPPGEILEIEITKAQLSNMVVDGAGMALRYNSVHAVLDNVLNDLERHK